MSFAELLCKLGLHKFTVIEVEVSSKGSKVEEIVCSRCGFQTNREISDYHPGSFGP